MILVDYREKPHKKEKTELVTLINRFGVKAEITDLSYGDFAFEGRDSKGLITIGVERKRLHDMLACIDDSRFSAHQRIGMMGNLYAESYLLIEGIWRPHDPGGWLMEGDNKGNWWECRPGGRNGRPVLYSKLRSYLFSIQRSGMPVLYTRDMSHTAYDLCKMYSYYQKKEHTALLSKQKLNIPSLNGRPPLVQRWAMEIDGVDIKHGAAAARLFKTPQGLANSEWEEWASIPKIGLKTARDIVRQIEGGKK